MTDSTAIALVAFLVLVFAGLWVFNGKQKRKFEEERRQRKRDLAALKAKAAQKAEQDNASE